MVVYLSNGDNQYSLPPGSTDDVYGNGGDDTIVGNAGNNLLDGGNGKDVFFSEMKFLAPSVETTPFGVDLEKTI